MRIKRIIHKEISSGRPEITLGKEYIVYGMIIKENKPWFYICESHEDFPIAKLSDLFEVVDSKISRYWIYGFKEYEMFYPTWMFPEWITE